MQRIELHEIYKLHIIYYSNFCPIVLLFGKILLKNPISISNEFSNQSQLFLVAELMENYPTQDTKKFPRVIG